MIDLTTTSWAIKVFLAGCRAGGMLAVAPPVGHVAVPVRLRIALGLVLAVAMAPSAGVALRADLLTAGGILSAAAGELAIGLTLGLAVAALLAAGRLAAMHVATQMGIGLGEALAPGVAGSAGPVSRLYEILLLAAFVLLGGATGLVEGLLESLRALPLGGAFEASALAGMLAGVLDASMLLALKLAAPVLAAMLLATAAVAAVQRTLPAVHTLTVGLPLRGILGLLVLAAAVLTAGPMLAAAWATASERIFTGTFQGATP